MLKSRNVVIDTLRGIACILLVSYHVIGSNESNGLNQSEGFYRSLNDFLVYIRMPLFTFLSGYVYANRPYKADIQRYIRGKVRRLLLPMFFVGTIFAILQSLISSSNNQVENWHLIHIIPVAHFWFIEAIFVIFLFMIFLEHFNLLSTRFRFFIVFLFSAVFYILNVSINVEYFALSGAIYLLPYFLFGLFVNRFDLVGRVNNTQSLMLVIITVLILFGIATDHIIILTKHSYIPLLVGCLSCFVLISLKLKSEVLARIGVFSYGIYLYHVFFTAGSRIVFTNLGVTNVTLLFIVSLFIGVLGPILVDIVLSKNSYLRKNFLGK
ncbi:acyltransferase family protein [Vibrio atypicus]|uniref:acyltransferase family protein n=1 Tax=Vibrio atypicus TaxID=558271 RepID=UPI003735E8B4